MLDKQFWENIFEEYPYPIALQSKVAWSETNPRVQLDEVIRLSEWIFRYASILTLINYITNRHKTAEASSKISNSLCQPSMGSWFEIGRTAVRHYEKDSFWPHDLPRFFKINPDNIIAERNKLSHFGIHPSDDQCIQIRNSIFEELQSFLNFEFYTALYLKSGNHILEGHILPITNLKEGNILLRSRLDEKLNRALEVHPFICLRSTGFCFDDGNNQYIQKTLNQPHFFFFQSSTTSRRVKYVEIAPVESGINHKFFVQGDLKQIGSFLDYSIEVEGGEVWKGVETKFSITLENQGDSDLIIDPFELQTSKGLEIKNLPEIRSPVILSSGENSKYGGSLLCSEDKSRPNGWIKIKELNYLSNLEAVSLKPGPICQFRCYPFAEPQVSFSVVVKNSLDGKSTFPVEAKASIEIYVENIGGPANNVSLNIDFSSTPNSKIIRNTYWENRIGGNTKKWKVAEIEFESEHTGEISLAASITTRTDEGIRELALFKWTGIIVREGQPFLIVNGSPTVTFLSRDGATIRLLQEFKLENIGSSTAIINKIVLGLPRGCQGFVLRLNDQQATQCEGISRRIAVGEKILCAIEATGNIKQSANWPATIIQYADFDKTHANELRIPGIAINAWQATVIHGAIGREKQIENAIDFLLRKREKVWKNNLKILWVKGRPLAGKSRFVSELLRRITKLNHEESNLSTNEVIYNCGVSRSFGVFLANIVREWIKPPEMPPEIWQLKFNADCNTWIKRCSQNDEIANIMLRRLLVDQDLQITDDVIIRIAQVAKRSRNQIMSVIVLYQLENASDDFLAKFGCLLMNTPSEAKDMYVLVSWPDPRIEDFLSKFLQFSLTFELLPLSKEDLKQLIDQIKPLPMFSDNVKSYIIDKSEGMPGVVKHYCEILSQAKYTKIINDEMQFRADLSPAQLSLILDTSNLEATNVSYIGSLLDACRQHFSFALYHTIAAILEIATLLNSEFYLNEIRNVIAEVIPPDVMKSAEIENSLDYLTSLTILKLLDRETHSYRLSSRFNRSALMQLLFQNKENRKEKVIGRLINNFLEILDVKGPFATSQQKILANLLIQSNLSVKQNNLSLLVDVAHKYLEERDFLSVERILNSIREFKHLLPGRQLYLFHEIESQRHLNQRAENRPKDWVVMVQKTINDLQDLRENGDLKNIRSDINLLIAKLYYYLDEFDNALLYLKRTRTIGRFLFSNTILRQIEDITYDAWELKTLHNIDPNSKYIAKQLDKCKALVSRIFRLRSRIKDAQWFDIVMEYVESLANCDNDYSQALILKLRNDFSNELNVEQLIRLDFLRAKYFENSIDKANKEDFSRLKEAKVFADQLQDITLMYKVNFAIGNWLFDKKDFSSAIEHLEIAKSNFPTSEFGRDDYKLIYRLAYSYYILAMDKESVEDVRIENAKKALEYKQEILNSYEKSQSIIQTLEEKGRLLLQISELHKVLGDRLRELSVKIEAIKLVRGDLALTLFQLGILYLQKQDYNSSIEHLRRAVKNLSDSDQRFCYAKLARAYHLNQENKDAISAYQKYVELLFKQNVTLIRRSKLYLFIFRCIVDIWNRVPTDNNLIISSLQILKFVTELPEQNRETVLQIVIESVKNKGEGYHVLITRLVVAETLADKGYVRQALEIVKKIFRPLLDQYIRSRGKEAQGDKESRTLLMRAFKHLYNYLQDEKEKQIYANQVHRIAIDNLDYSLLASYYKTIGDYYGMNRDMLKAKENYSKCKRIIELTWESPEELVRFMKELAVSLFNVDEGVESHDLLVKCLELCLEKGINDQIHYFYTLLSDFHGLRHPFFVRENEILVIYHQARTQEILGQTIDYFLDHTVRPEIFTLLYSTAKILSQYIENETIGFDINNYLYAHRYQVSNHLHDLGVTYVTREDYYLGLALLHASFDLDLLNEWPYRSPVNSTIYFNTLVTIWDLLTTYILIGDYYGALEIIIKHLTPKLHDTLCELRQSIDVYGLRLDEFPLIDMLYSRSIGFYGLVDQISTRYSLNNSFLTIKTISQFMNEKQTKILLDELLGMTADMQQWSSSAQQILDSGSGEIKSDIKRNQGTIRRINEAGAKWFQSKFPIHGSWLKYLFNEKQLLIEARVILAPLSSLDKWLTKINRSSKKERDTILDQFRKLLSLISESMDYDKMVKNWDMVKQYNDEKITHYLKNLQPLLVCIKMARAADFLQDADLVDIWCERGLRIELENPFLIKLKNWAEVTKEHESENM